MKTTELHMLDRRSFLKLMGATSAVSTASLLMPGGFGVPGLVKDFFSGHDFKIGLLLPTSDTHEKIGSNLQAGIETYFGSEPGLNPFISVETVPNGYVDAADRALKLVKEDRVDIVVAGVSSQVAPRVRNVFEQAEVPYIVSNTGASPIASTDLGRYGIHNSLGLWESSWATGEWAGRNVGKNGVVVTTLADSGNASSYGFQLGLETAGGNVLDFVYSDLPGEGMESVIERVTASDPDFVYAMLSGDAGAEFLGGYESWGRPPLFASSFMAEGFALPDSAGSAMLASVGTWAENIDTDENVAFTARYRLHAGRKPDPFAVLGFETARLIGDSVMATGDPAGNGVRLADQLTNAVVMGPRGQVKIDPYTRSAVLPLYMRETRSRRSTWRNHVVEELPQVSLSRAQEAGIDAATRSGLLNEFLCCV